MEEEKADGRDGEGKLSQKSSHDNIRGERLHNAPLHEPMDYARAKLVNRTHTTRLIVIRGTLSAALAPDGASPGSGWQVGSVITRREFRWPDTRG